MTTPAKAAAEAAEAILGRPCVYTSGGESSHMIRAQLAAQKIRLDESAKLIERAIDTATADLARENAQLLADLEHMAQQGGGGSCADYAVENQKLRREIERLKKLTTTHTGEEK